MSDRKYRQRGYQDDNRDRPPQQQKPGPAQAAPRGPRERPEGPKTPNLMAAHEVVKCTRCGNPVTQAVSFESKCNRCGADLHSCSQCISFDPGSRFQCMQPVTERITAKDAKNTCTLFGPRTTIERQTGSAAPTSARKAFDDLFKL